MAILLGSAGTCLAQLVSSSGLAQLWPSSCLACADVADTAARVEDLLRELSDRHHTLIVTTPVDVAAQYTLELRISTRQLNAWFPISPCDQTRRSATADFGLETHQPGILFGTLRSIRVLRLDCAYSPGKLQRPHFASRTRVHGIFVRDWTLIRSCQGLMLRLGRAGLRTLPRHEMSS